MRSRPNARTRLPSLNATAHVLRHLGDVSALSGNALVREVWDARASEHVTLDEVAEGVRSAALAALEAGAAWPSAEKRLRDVLVRCDVEAQPHARVMTDLAISRAELYRRLAAGRRFVAQAIRERFAGSKASASPFDRPLDIRMQGALALVMSGRADDAVRHLAPLLETATGADLVVVACALAEIRLEAKLPVEAQAYVMLAAAEAERLRGTNRTVALAKVASIGALAQTKAGRGTRQTEAELDRHIDALRPLPEPDRLTCDTLSALVLLKAALTAYRGDAAEGLRVLRTSPAADSARPVSPRPRAEYLTMLVAIRLLIPGELAAALEDDRHLYALATAHGLQHAVTAALAHRATIEGTRGNFEIAARYATEALAASSAFMPRFEHAGVCTMAAWTALGAGRPREARALAGEARSCAGPGSYPALLAGVYEMDAYRMEGRFSECARSGEPLERALDETAHPQLLGIVRRIRAALYVERGDDARARRALGDSLDLLRATGRSTDLLRTLELACELWADRRIRDEANQLRAAIGMRA